MLITKLFKDLDSEFIIEDKIINRWNKNEYF